MKTNKMSEELCYALSGYKTKTISYKVLKNIQIKNILIYNKINNKHFF